MDSKWLIPNPLSVGQPKNIKEEKFHNVKKFVNKKLF